MKAQKRYQNIVWPKMSSEPLLARVVDDIPPPHCNEDGNKTTKEGWRDTYREMRERREGRGFFALALSFQILT